MRASVHHVVEVPKATSGFYKGYSKPIALMSKSAMIALVIWALMFPLNANEVLSSGHVAGGTPEAVQSAFRYTFLHYGFHAWAVYVVTGLSLAYYAYTRGMPLTIRSTLTPILGRYTNGLFGHVVDVLGVVATILGVSVTIGFGVAQLVDGAYLISHMSWLMEGEPTDLTPSSLGLLVALGVIMALSIISAVSGVGRGVKYLSNLNMVLSLILLSIFAFFGSFLFAKSPAQFAATLPSVAESLSSELYEGATSAWGSFDSFRSELTGAAAQLPDSAQHAAYDAGAQGRLFNWQSGWTTFYWAWWIAFSPFVGLFLASISRGRTIREFVVGCTIAPALVCFLWMVVLGGTAVDIELAGGANPSIVDASTTAKLFATLENILSGGFLKSVAVMCVVLILTFLVTSADSGILVMNTIMSGGSPTAGIKHRIVWGLILTGVIAALIIAGHAGATADPFEALKNAMIIGAFPFALVMLAMCAALAKAIYQDHHHHRLS
ncbi:MAG: BCCT family transporter [Gammaproteobacteria bacterium]